MIILKFDEVSLKSCFIGSINIINLRIWVTNKIFLIKFVDIYRKFKELFIVFGWKVFPMF